MDTETTNGDGFASDEEKDSFFEFSMAAPAEYFPVPKSDQTSVRFQSAWPTVTV